MYNSHSKMPHGYRTSTLKDISKATPNYFDPHMMSAIPDTEQNNSLQTYTNYPDQHAQNQLNESTNKNFFSMEEQDQARTLQHTSVIDNTSMQNERNVQSDQNRVFQGSNFLSHLSHPFGQYSTIYAGSKYNLAKTTATKDH